ncbi:SMI1/KNR4 family protein [Burkholderia ubonensis]|uniref:Knr4/Smi1-like domain-containing protein n=1 Tax=Burkholderia ubonensis TaxID=101571 RepID=A0ABD6PYF7_9BURK|nr:SMI1/KNR4 family protein [Burkholderia ubonensis]KVX88201.1 hypothetical protein WL08_30390 [Burkholderia ubonensis]KWE84494.1 hypothetical protein WL80_23375 [Burkholderia ubonensis]OJA43632.1 hypothetical protein BGV66_23770 [Burkholderia ubonensis]
MHQEAEKILAELRASPLFAPDFPKRAAHSIADWARLPEEERRKLDHASDDAMRRVRAVYRPWEDGVRTLGALRYTPAIPLLAQLWRDCALTPVRNSAGHALLAMDNPASCDVLEALITDRDALSIHLGVRAVFRRDPVAAFDRFAPLFAEPDIAAATIGQQVLSLFVPSMFIADGTKRWTESDAPLWLEQDSRWLALCAGLCQDERYGDAARATLQHAAPDRALPALEAARAKRPPPPTPATRAAGDLVTRYKAGDHLGTWGEARAFAAIAGDLRAEIRALAGETMLRVAHNVALISERLRDAEWHTLDPMRTLPEAADAARITAIEQMTGAPLPPSLDAFWRVVGGVSWVWDYDEDTGPVIGGLPLADIDTDALSIAPCSTIESLCFDTWVEQKDVIHPDLIGPFRLDLAPDRLHKLNISGGPPYAIELPFPGADPLFLQEDSGLPFVDYLRDCFAWAGFPRLKHHADEAAARRFVATLGRGLEPF